MTGQGWRFTLLGYHAGFGRPWMLALILVALTIGAVALWSALRRRARVQGLLSPRFVDALAPGVSLFRPALRSGFTATGLALLALALAQPQCGTTAELTKRRGIDVVVALDASKSMLAQDVAPSRLERAKLELLTLLDELKGDRVALVVFAGDAFLQCPLTADYEAAKLFLRAVDPAQMPQGGTNIGAALTLARKVFDGADRGSKDKVVVLLSDGEDVTGDVKDGITVLKEAGVRIYAVGIGSEAGEPIPLTDRRGDFVGYQKDSDGNTVITRLDRATLMSVAEQTGGEFFHQPKSVAMSEIVARIDKLQKNELESRVAVRFDERFQRFALAGVCFLLAAMVLPASRRVTPLIARTSEPASASSGEAPAPASEGGAA